MANKRGKFIVIDGIDGTGKATQVELLAGRLDREGIKVKTIDFPRYYDNFFGKLIGECLAGKHGNFAALAPQIASVLYAADRFEAKKTIEGWLKKGYLVIADRYASANQIHQGGKIHDQRKRTEFLKWLDTMEHRVFGIPRPDLIIYLDLPLKLSLELLDKKSGIAASSQKKRYAESDRDTVENDLVYLENSRGAALKMVAASNKWSRVDCAPEAELLTKGDIHLHIMAIVKKELGLQ